ncbi:sirohydrochlorin chelatase [Dietzia psychralcaliphila]|uniref:Cobalamin biosynthesis protein n=2 Tax=Dietzia psychralcaliphila TaxID=139021 RepID=A0AAD0NPS9_9ACTN|nr:CbiX/SirB N-terminal domain-containing protein [Dietzia psychralcaliphila]AWH94273.1 cobalamin biosynthesis protein [Dietzia psychralcaliphila]PTM87873.1 sirohydrochlorin ferrochelatase [Dietzia psychralcaliphila]
MTTNAPPAEPGPEKPRLLLVAHGTRSSTGRRELGRVLVETRKKLDGVDCRLAWVDVQAPGPDRILADAAPTVVVPAFLARGFHVTEDVEGACRRAPGPVALAPHVGAEPEIVRALVQRLAEAGAVGAFGADAVVLGAAGSRDESSQAETRALAASLGRLLRVPATAGFASAASPTVTEAIAGFREQGHRRVAVATHLLAPGFFADRLAAAGADVTSPPLGANPEIVDLIVRLYLENSAGLIR